MYHRQHWRDKNWR